MQLNVIKKKKQSQLNMKNDIIVNFSYILNASDSQYDLQILKLIIIIIFTWISICFLNLFLKFYQNVSMYIFIIFFLILLIS